MQSKVHWGLFKLLETNALRGVSSAGSTLLVARKRSVLQGDRQGPPVTFKRRVIWTALFS